jgi:hypothetical protein
MLVFIGAPLDPPSGILGAVVAAQVALVAADLGVGDPAGAADGGSRRLLGRCLGRSPAGLLGS